MPFLPILLSKIKLHHVSELGVTCWVGWVCVGGVPPLVLFLPKVRRLAKIQDNMMNNDIFSLGQISALCEYSSLLHNRALCGSQEKGSVKRLALLSIQAFLIAPSWSAL